MVEGLRERDGTNESDHGPGGTAISEKTTRPASFAADADAAAGEMVEGLHWHDG
jgi:hypothetical protein